MDLTKKAKVTMAEIRQACDDIEAGKPGRLTRAKGIEALGKLLTAQVWDVGDSNPHHPFNLRELNSQEACIALIRQLCNEIEAGQNVYSLPATRLIVKQHQPGGMFTRAAGIYHIGKRLPMVIREPITNPTN
jgi:hypothetical protein